MTFWNKILVLLPAFLDISGEYMNGNMKSKIKMGEARQDCDDGVNGNDIDWDGNPRNYTCYHPDTLLLGSSTRSVVECKDLPSDYSPQHFCLGTPIKYPHPVPHHGNHRPIWPKFGEYRFVPAQRWLHNIEHGAVVMLYHPCTHPILVQQLRDLLTGCIRKHIITPHNDLPEDKPLALVAWGCRLLISSSILYSSR
ncbi:uncharacterized protein LOC111700795 isoform X2 [Eurytemora carolleeae]|uniref:uncharacterized protein LOC111700795 isoform X2 n=1 Tax=Eurytemora carolleeae TaxID=1294199 RepID=UPI000C75E58C|nr:uncharacterized protein LOC111700795 isoform X2 [Eurytemora carolleeae]|eukprot:XP_023327604.1 uncharacterized protein LOC111700795 isoform X2 [Eurytemora affinis]